MVPQREHELSQARALRSAHIAGDLDAHVLDFAFYEVGNVLSRALRWTGVDVADQLGVPLVSADRRLIEAGLAESSTDIATRLRLRLD